MDFGSDSTDYESTMKSGYPVIPTGGGERGTTMKSTLTLRQDDSNVMGVSQVSCRDIKDYL